MTPDGYVRDVNFFKWLYRLPGRINRSFGSTAVASGVEAPGAASPQINAVGVQVMRGEIEREMGGTSGEKSQPPDNPGSRHDSTSE
jgi:hypothetical protein